MLHIIKSLIAIKTVHEPSFIYFQGSGTALVAGNNEHSETFGTSGQTVVTNLESRPSINEIDEIDEMDEMKNIAETELNSISDVDSQLKLTNLYP